MTLPSSGAISLGQIAGIVYNNPTTSISLNDTDVRTLLNISTGAIDVNAGHGKPVAGNSGSTYNVPGSYTFLVPAYEYLTANVAAGGGAGGGYCGGQVFIGSCVNYCVTGSGSSGANSSFNGVIAYRGAGGLSCGGGAGAKGGNNQNGSTGGGGAGGAGSTNPADTNCNQAGGSPGGAGGFASVTWKKAVTGPAYKASLSLTVGARGLPGAAGCRYQPGDPGANGYVYIAWS